MVCTSALFGGGVHCWNISCFGHRLLQFLDCARPARLSARLAEGIVYDLSVIALERSGFRLYVYKPPIAVYR